MKKNQTYGIVALALGVLLLVPLILAGYAGKAGGSESFFKMIGNFTATGTPTWYVFAALAPGGRDQSPLLRQSASSFP